MDDIHLDIWLYGNLASYAADQSQGSFANLNICLPLGSTVADLLEELSMPTEARGITFINGAISALPGLQPDLPHVLQEGDRVAFFHLNSMWPFQYRFGAPAIPEMTQALRQGDSPHHSYKE